MSIENDAPPIDPAMMDTDIAPPEPRRQVSELVTEEIPEAEQVTTLTDEERADFARLITVGKRTKKLTVMDHVVIIKTLRTADEMRVGLYTKDYLDSQGFSRAYQVGVCAAGVVEIDGMPIYSSLSTKEDGDEIFRKSAEKLSEFYPIVISQIYDAIIALEREFADLVIKLGKNPRLDESTEMEIRLAHYQGLLSKPNLNWFQYFAANYWLRMERRVALDDAEENLQRQTYYLEPNRYNDLFLAGELIGTEPVDLEPDEPVDDISEIDRYFDNLDNKKSMSGAQLFGLLEPDEDGWM